MRWPRHNCLGQNLLPFVFIGENSNVIRIGIGVMIGITVFVWISIVIHIIDFMVISDKQDE